jgi:uncharacterized protein YqhQ
VVAAVRHPQGNIVFQTETLSGPLYQSNWAKLPLIRGPINLWDTLNLGVRALLFSANVAVDDGQSKETQSPASSGMVWGTMALSLGLAMLVFFALPALLASLLDQYQNITSSFVSNLAEKVLRLAMLVGYIWGIGFMPEIRRVYAYHGAEHKTVNAFEAGVPLQVNDVQKYSTAHPRCGTSFLLVVVVVSFVFFLLLGQPDLVWRVLSRVLLIPVVAGVAYELIRLGGKYQHKSYVGWLLAPGLWLQSLTTREPDDDQVEVAIAAMQKVLDDEEAETSATLMPEPVPVES